MDSPRHPCIVIESLRLKIEYIRAHLNGMTAALNELERSVTLEQLERSLELEKKK
jgi:hypothetical protein